MDKEKAGRNKKISKIAFLAGFALFGLFFLSKKQAQPERLTFVLDFGDGGKKTYQASLSEKKRVWSLLQQVSAVSGINLEAKEGFYVKKIDGKENGSENKEWRLYVNGKRKIVSPYDVTVKAPAEVMFRFE